MSVIPLTITGPNASVLQKAEGFPEDGQAIYIGNLDLDQFTDKGEYAGASNASYDLRVGDRFRNHRERHWKQLPADGIITLHPGEAVIIQTHETIRMPNHMYGSISPKVKLLQQGVSTTYSKVDPGYPGHLLITVFNLGQTTVPLKREAPFCALTLFDVGARVIPYRKGEKQTGLAPAKQPRPPRNILD